MVYWLWFDEWDWPCSEWALITDSLSHPSTRPLIQWYLNKNKNILRIFEKRFSQETNFFFSFFFSFFSVSNDFWKIKCICLGWLCVEPLRVFSGYLYNQPIIHSLKSLRLMNHLYLCARHRGRFLFKTAVIRWKKNYWRMINPMGHDPFTSCVSLLCFKIHASTYRNVLTLMLLKWLIWPLHDDAKAWKMIETLTHGYSSESTQRELSNEYQHERVVKVALALEELWY